MSLYQSDPDKLPDSAYEPGTLRHLVPGNRGRLLDPRRTPVRVVAVTPETGLVTLRIEAFEDEGAEWRIRFERIEICQFERGGAEADETAVATYRAAVERLDRPLAIPADRSSRPHTLERIAAAREEAGAWLRRHSQFLASGEDLPDPEARTGSDALMGDLERFLEERGLADVDDRYATAFVSNPYSGEDIKALAIVLAELGLVDFHGTVVRDPTLFEGAGAKDERTRYLVARFGFVQALFAALGQEWVLLYRGYYLSGERRKPPEPPTFLSASFHRGIAASLAGAAGEGTQPVLLAQATRTSRVWMTYLETRAMNRQFREAEAVLLYAPDAPAF